MKSLLLATLLAACATTAVASEKHCTSAPKANWMSQDTFKAMIEKQGIKVKRIKVEDSCYEVYGFDKNGKKIEQFHDPVTGQHNPKVHD
jgi:hypothetical protein